MLRLLIDLAYVLALAAFSPVLLYRMIRHGRYRSDLGQRLGALPVRHGLQPRIWIHAVSLGEINGVRALVDHLAAELPSHQILISSTTATGIARARQLFEPGRVVFRFPLDFSLAMRRAFRRLRPDLVVLMEGEIWPNLLIEANRRRVPVVLVNGRMSRDKGYPRYRLARPVASWMFNKLTRLAVQDESYAERFVALGTDPAKVVVTGTMKFDTAEVADRVAGQDELAAALGVADGDRLIVAGGTGPGEEELLLTMFTRLRDAGRWPARTRLAIVPRKPERFDEVARLIERAGLPCLRRSSHADGATPPEAPDAVILGDTMGELRKFYALAEAVFVGRSLVHMGGSDMIEAAALAKPVAFGPHVFNFPQAKVLVDAGACRQVDDVDALGEVLAGWLAEPAAAGELGRAAQQVIRDAQGATRRTVEVICDVMGMTPSVAPGGIATRRIET